jgi:GT2 family glycosyltransferase
MNPTPLISVIIPTCHRNDLLAKCLDRLAPGQQTLAADRYEVIVTDDGSQTTACELMQQQYAWAKWAAGPRKGPAANRNHGARSAQGQWLVFTDDDCLPDAQWLAAYEEGITIHPEMRVFEGRTYVDRPRCSCAEIAPANETGGYLWSCNFAIQKQLFDQIHGFDERFPYAAMEDMDLEYRLRQLNCGCQFVPLAAVCHPWRPTGGWIQLKRHQYSRLVFLSLHPEELAKTNFKYYAWCLLRDLIKQVIPGIIEYRGRGVQALLLWYLSSIQTTLLILRLELNPKFRRKFIEP